MTTGADRRQHPRVRLLMGLAYRIIAVGEGPGRNAAQPGVQDESKVQDASLGGLGMVVSRPLPTDSIVEIDFPHAKDSFQSVPVRAKVVRCLERSPGESYEIGVQFQTFGGEASDAILAFLKSSA
jgi:hypothetical protein